MKLLTAELQYRRGGDGLLHRLPESTLIPGVLENATSNSFLLLAIATSSLALIGKLRRKNFSSVDLPFREYECRRRVSSRLPVSLSNNYTGQRLNAYQIKMILIRDFANDRPAML